jgi:hypothetical protein
MAIYLGHVEINIQRDQLVQFVVKRQSLAPMQPVVTCIIVFRADQRTVVGKFCYFNTLQGFRLVRGHMGSQGSLSRIRCAENM